MAQTPFVTPFNGLHKNQPEKHVGASETVPDDSFTVSELLRRQAQGLPLLGSRVPFYDEDESDSDIDFEKLDLAERQEMLEQYQDTMRRLEKARKRKADEDSQVQRTSGEGADQGKNPPPDNISYKNPGPGGARPSETIKEKGGEQ